MNDCIKIREVTARYEVSARTLRYYEDMGLINSIRSSDYAYRLYDKAAIRDGTGRIGPNVSIMALLYGPVHKTAIPETGTAASL